jgi:hypothetical protein
MDKFGRKPKLQIINARRPSSAKRLMRVDSDPRKSPLANLDGDAASVAATRLIAKKLASDTIAAAEAAE